MDRSEAKIRFLPDQFEYENRYSLEWHESTPLWVKMLPIGLQMLSEAYVELTHYQKSEL